MRSYGAGAPLLSGNHLVELHLIELGFASGTSRYNTSTWDIEALDTTWFAGHGLFGVEYGAEDLTLEAHGATVTLSAMNPSVLARAFIERVKGRYAAIHHVVMDPTTFAIVSVQKEFSGRMSGVEIKSGA